MSDTAISNSNNNQFFLDLETDDRKKSEPDVNIYIIPIPLNKMIEIIQDIYNIYIESKYIKIVKYKTITLIILKFEKIYNNF